MESGLEILIIASLTWIFSQLLKFLLISVREMNFDINNFFKVGGMPSSHSATVISLGVSVGIFEGFGSAIFGVTAIFASLTIHDAVRVRGAIGKNFKILQTLLENTNLTKSHKENLEDIKISLGHDFSEVFFGILFGVISGLVGSWILM